MKKLMIGMLFLFVLSACAGGSSAPIQGKWKLVSYGSASSQTPTVPDVDTSIEFGPDGTLKGSVGCNSFGGDYKVKGDAITFGAIAATEMFCEAVAEQEVGTFAVFQGSAPFVLDGNTLTVTSEDGKSVVVLGRK